MDAPAWTAIIPVKPFAAAKSRLPNGAAFAEAFLRDVISALHGMTAISRVVIVTADPVVASLAHAHGCDVTHEEHLLGINEAVTLAARDIHEGGIIVVLGDLPCLTSEALEAALTDAARHDTAFVSDEGGTGSTIWCRRDGAPTATHFGVRSRAAHRFAGAVEIDPEPGTTLSARLHRDVDTEVDLWDAIRIGVGSQTARLLDSNKAT